jgi:hypothetical protein
MCIREVDQQLELFAPLKKGGKLDEGNDEKIEQKL